MKIFWSVLSLVIVLFAAAAGLFIYLNSPVTGFCEETVIVEIEKGESLKKISEKLEHQGLIRSSLLMRVIGRLKDTQLKMKSGQYSISCTMNTLEIHDLIVSGAGLLYKVTIPEGMTSTRIADLLEKNRITDSESFLASVSDRKIIERFAVNADTLEGYLFPDSYLFPQNYPAEKVVTFMVNNFFQKLASVYPSYKTLTAEEIRDRVILASIIEREYRLEKEAPLIASVFLNRLKTGMALGSCATVEYIITEIQKKPHPEFLTYADIAIESDYNTYIRRGLPPGAISNPGLVAIASAFNPADTDFYYFLLKDRATGEHFFSRRLSEHNEARVIYLKK